MNFKKLVVIQDYYEAKFQQARQFMRIGKFISEYRTVLILIRENTKD